MISVTRACNIVGKVLIIVATRLHDRATLPFKKNVVFVGFVLFANWGIDQFILVYSGFGNYLGTLSLWIIFFFKKCITRIS